MASIDTHHANTSWRVPMPSNRRLALFAVALAPLAMIAFFAG